MDPAMLGALAAFVLSDDMHACMQAFFLSFLQDEGRACSSFDLRVLPWLKTKPRGLRSHDMTLIIMRDRCDKPSEIMGTHMRPTVSFKTTAAHYVLQTENMYATRDERRRISGCKQSWLFGFCKSFYYCLFFPRSVPTTGWCTTRVRPIRWYAVNLFCLAL